MHTIERFVFALRHNPSLERADWLWNGLRPAYDWLSSVLGGKGLERVINGTDRVLLAPRWRMISEVYEPEVWNRLVSEVKLGDVIADVGAHIGLYSLALAKRVGPLGRVVAFEPDSSNFIALKEHVELNGLAGRVELRDTAVGATSCRVRFNARGSSVSAISNSAMQSLDRDQTTVKCVTLDDVFLGSKLDLLKIDVEGYEERVIFGAKDLLKDESRRPRAIFIEVHPYAWPELGTSSRSFLNLLASYDYHVQDLDGKPIDYIEQYGEVVATSRRSC
jgi:FkbM family methyltransferase